MKEILKIAKDKLDETSSTFCPAKWLQLTLHLENGHNHSCHHPETHVAPLDEVEISPSVLHNTLHKKKIRKMLFEGIRAPECQYCWNIERDNKEFFSDRILKATDSWCATRIDQVVNLPWDEDIIPSYLEVSFSSYCNLRCIYCYPHISSSIHNEYQRFGDYYKLESLSSLKKRGKIVDKAIQKRYLDAFWRWYPTLINELEVFRITGGEPLLHASTYRLLNDFIKIPRPLLELCINSNFCVHDSAFKRFIEVSRRIIDEKSVKKYEVYVSIDTFGEQAEYIRFGMDYKQLINNIEQYLEIVRGPVVLMVTYNILSMPRFKDFLKVVLRLKNRARELGIVNGLLDGVLLDISQLIHPHFLNVKIADELSIRAALRSIQFMKDNQTNGFSDYEIQKLERIIDYIENANRDIFEINRCRRDFANFICEYDQRKGTCFNESFPELNLFLAVCKKMTREENNA